MGKRKCPSCDTDLTEEEFHHTMVDRCEECGGIYFDAGELESILKIIELYTNTQLGETDIDTLQNVEQDRQLRCPADGASFEKHEVGGQIIDICPECRGIWLDAGELFALKIAEEHITSNLSLYVRLAE